MGKLLCALTAAALLSGLAACTTVSTVDLAAVADKTYLRNITTGDGTFENYRAVGRYTGTEVGFGIGFPFVKIKQIYPDKSNEALLIETAREAARGGANAMINVVPASEHFFGFIIGVYVDRCAGTGIKTR